MGFARASWQLGRQIAAASLLLAQLAKDRDYGRWLSITDDVEAAVKALLDYDAC